MLIVYLFIVLYYLSPNLAVSFCAKTASTRKEKIIIF